MLNLQAMKISWKWLNEILPVPMDVDAAAKLLTDIGLEVEAVTPYESVKGGMQGLVTGQVMTCEKHPDADKLKLTTVDVGSGELLHIVCGAPNVAAGQKVIVATNGTTVYPTQGEPFTIKKAKIRGQESNGMLCAEDEIGLGSSHAGLLILPENTPIGIPVASLFDIYTDHIIEIGLTANHADANSHIGTARELRAALISRMQKDIAIQYPQPEHTITVNKQSSAITLKVEDTACLRYSGVLIEDITIADSPAWLQHRLRAVGMRPINNVVDITNYILHLFGQPLHAFDADAIKGNTVVVKKLPAGTSFTTLDNKARALKADDLMICNAEEGMCIAGVYGGLHSGVTASTKRIFLESAYFDPAHIRRTESAHGLKTDASARFAKGTDIEITVTALQLAASMIAALCGGKINGDIIDHYPVALQPFAVDLRMRRLAMISSIDIPVATVKNIFAALGIQITGETSDVLHTAVPTYKNDVTREIDLIEEVLRMYGFNNIPVPGQVRTPYIVSPKPDREKVKLDVVNYLVARGGYEIATNAISKSKYHQQFLPDIAPNTVQLLNSLNIELDSMRLSMAFTGLEVVAYNCSHKQTDLNLFEFGRVYAKAADGYAEKEVIGMYRSGNHFLETWRTAQRKNDLFDLKSDIQSLMERMGVRLNWQSENVQHPLADLFSAPVLVLDGKQVIGIFGSVKKDVLSAFGIKQPVYFAEIDWIPLIERFAARKVIFKEISKFPEMRRDLALVINKDVDYARIESIARTEGKAMLRDVVLFDVFEGEQLAGRKSYAIGLTFSDSSRTLTDTEVDAVMQKLMSRYEKELEATIRR